MQEIKQKSLMELTEKAKRWVKNQPPGEFSAYVFGKELYVADDVGLRDQILRDLRTMRIIEPCGKKRGCYQAVVSDCREMNWQSAESTYYSIWFPLELHEICGVQRKNVVVLAGETNAGKTAFVLRTIYHNLKCNGGAHDEIRLFNSEMGDGELHGRVMNIDNNLSSWNGFRSFERTRDFHHVIDPDGFNVIDYLEVQDEFYLVGKWIRQIHERLRDGIAIVCLQKPQDREKAWGGDLSLEKCRLAVSLFFNHGVHSCKIIKCKHPLGKINPQGMERDFIVESGRRISYQSQWRYLTAKERKDLNKKREKDAAAAKTREALGL